MLFAWFGQTEKKPAKKSAQPLRTMPRVETLETRFMPGAIRSLPGYTANSLPHEDDSPSSVANLGFNINFFGVQTGQVYVNNNGNITFGTPLAQYTPTGLNSNDGGIPIIAPFFADVDTRPTNGPVVTYGTSTLCGLPSFAVNYINVGYYDQHTSPTDSFQVVLIDRSDVGPGDFDIEFNYDNIQWETGDASDGVNGLGGQSAHVGYSNGTGDPGTFFELPGSGVNGAFLNGGPDSLISNSLLSSTAGRYTFEVRDGVVMQQPAVNNDVTSGTRVFFPFRYDRDPSTDIWTGNLTVLNAMSSNSALALCLDEGLNPNAPIPGPINVVFTSLPSNIQLLNATGVTASGDPYLALNVSELPQGQPVARAQIQLLDRQSVPTTSFEMGYPVKVYSGPFDPTML